MAGVEDAGEGETADLSCPAADVGGVCLDIGVAGLAEDAAGDLVGGDVEGDLFAAEPVALVVSVAVDKGDLGAVVEEAAKSCEAVAEYEVAGFLEDLGRGPSEAGEVEGYAEGLLDLGSVEVSGCPLGWEGSDVWRGDVEVIALGIAVLGTAGLACDGVILPP